MLLFDAILPKARNDEKELVLQSYCMILKDRA